MCDVQNSKLDTFVFPFIFQCWIYGCMLLFSLIKYYYLKILFLLDVAMDKIKFKHNLTSCKNIKFWFYKNLVEFAAILYIYLALNIGRSIPKKILEISHFPKNILRYLHTSVHEFIPTVFLKVWSFMSVLVRFKVNIINYLIS